MRDRLERQPWGEHGVWRWEGNGKQSRTGAQKGSLGLRCPLLASLDCYPLRSSLSLSLCRSLQVSQYLERLTGDLEAAAHPALDALTGKVGFGTGRSGVPRQLRWRWVGNGSCWSSPFNQLASCASSRHQVSAAGSSISSSSKPGLRPCFFFVCSADQHQQPGARAAHQEQDGAADDPRGDGERLGATCSVQGFVAVGCCKQTAGGCRVASSPCSCSGNRPMCTHAALHVV